MPKQRTLPYIILGMLASEPGLTGRQMSLLFEKEIGEFWSAAHSQIYPELRRMTSDGWILLSTSPDNAKERYYQITELGKSVLDDWILADHDEPQYRDFFALKLFFIKDKSDPRIDVLVAGQMEVLERKLGHLKEREQQLFASQAAIDADYGHYLILSRAIARTESQLTWLQNFEQGRKK